MYKTYIYIYIYIYTSIYTHTIPPSRPRPAACCRAASGPRDGRRDRRTLYLIIACYDTFYNILYPISFYNICICICI